MQVCKGFCFDYKAPNIKDRLVHGQKHCDICEIWMYVGGYNCLCCGCLLRQKPRARKPKERYYKIMGVK